MTDADITKAAKHTHALLRSEKHRKADYIALFASILERLTTGKVEPTALEILQARLLAIEVWRYQRITEDADYIKALDDEDIGHFEMRRKAFKDTDERGRLREIVLASMVQTNAMFKMLKADVKDYRKADPPTNKQGSQV